ncbi:hypothetical protein KSS94_07645 [Pseudomonas fakonensis]|uniref:Ig-like domain-containing protein n=1 Tax=Pseudomonas fakonensis TaxID=2842355 RepID=A0ABX8N9E4_9PSED|nr:hypothetical protein [Pseudomonas fakonensis]QXH52989.1 hypothetical protein KSS94_07645 [Pseudomonas fakonensis]
MFKRIACWIWSCCKRTGGAQATPAFDDLLPLPVVPGQLADVPGGQPNLLPVSALGQPLRVEVPMWPISQPERGEETLQVFWDGQVIFDKRWTVPVAPADLLFDVPVRYLVEGSPLLRYEVTLYNGALGKSHALTLTIDQTAPALATPDDRLLLDAQVIADGVTVEYLENNGDQLLAQVPGYLTPEVGDQIRYYWDRLPGDDDLAGEQVLTVDDLGVPVQLVVTGDLIRDRGDGDRHLHYRITDRAGNPSRASGVVTLVVKATAAPRPLSWPELAKASGSGETVTLDLDTLRGELEARIPDDAGVGSQEPVEMQWGTPGTTGAATLVGSPGTRVFSIPYQRLAAHSGLTLPLYYKATNDESSRRLVRVLPYKPYAPPPQVLEADADILSLAKVVGAAHISQRAWPLISTDQRVRVRMLGPGVEYPVLDAHPVTQAEIDAEMLGGTAAWTVPRTFLEGLALGSPLRVQVSVSLDAGLTWPSIPSFELQLRLVD